MATAFALLAFVGLFSSSPAFAQASPERSREYKRAIGQALQEFEAGNFPEARALFMRAHEISPNARTFRGLGFVAFELRNYEQCVQYLEAALAEQTRALEGELRRSTEELLARAREMIAHLTLHVAPHADSVLLDGVPVDVPPNGELVLQVGDHVLEVRATGYLSERRALRISGGEHMRVDITMKPAAEPVAALRPVAAPASDANRADAAQAKSWARSPWLWTALAVVVVGAGVGTYFLVAHHNDSGVAAATTTGNTPPGGVIEALRF